MDMLQALVDRINKEAEKERAITQLTLGGFIDRLKELPSDTRVDNLESPHSYRGYYSDLAFERGEGTTTAAALLALCKDCMGEEFIGYKGGEFIMGKNTPVWVANYGSCGERIMAITSAGRVETSPED